MREQLTTETMTYKEEVIIAVKESKTAKPIYDILRFGENNANELRKMIVKNSNDFTKDIAVQGINAYENFKTIEDEYGNEQEIPTEVRALTIKQVWCLAYQIFNNKNVYIS